MCLKLLIIIRDNQFQVLDINFSHFSPKKAKKTHFQIRILVPPMTKLLQKPFFGIFEPPKEYGGLRHRYLGKVKFFRVNWITKRGQKCDFHQGRAFKAPPYGRVKADPLKTLRSILLLTCCCLTLSESEQSLL